MTPARTVALTGLVGNHVIARMVDQERHTHGAGCGHPRVEETVPKGRRAPVVARAKDKKGKGKASGSGGGASWEQRAKAIAEIGRQHTCEQPNKSWGRVRDEITVRYPRSYKHQPDEQSLRHIARALYNAVEHQEQQAQQRGRKTDGKQAKPQGVQMVGDPNQEVQVMLYNGHLVITANQDASLDLLHQWLLDDDAKQGKATAQDAPGHRLRQVLTTDFNDAGHEPDLEEEAEEAPAERGKRPAPASGHTRSKRRRTEGGDTARAPSKGQDPDRAYRDRQARLKIGEGLRPPEREQPGTPMDADGGADAQSGSFVRDNRTLQALRSVKHVRKVDVSNELAEDPAYRQHLAMLLSAKASGYAYLLYNSGSDGVQHAEQKLLMLLNNADITGENAEGDVLIRGRKRPCQACLGLLNYFKSEMGIDIRYNDRGNHYFINAVDTATQSFPGQAAVNTESVDGHLGEQLRHGRMFAAAPSGATPAPAFPAEGVHEPEMGAEGGVEQRKQLKKYTTADGRTGRLYPRNAGLKGPLDTPSTSEADDPAAAAGTRGALEATFRQLSLRDTKETAGTSDLESAPDNREQRAREEQERRQAWFEGNIVPQLRTAAGAEFWKVVEQRTDGGGKFGTVFPDALRRKIAELTAADPELIHPIRQRLRVSLQAMTKQLGRTGQNTRRLARPMKEVPGAENAIEAAMPEGFRSGWLELRTKNQGKEGKEIEKWNPKENLLTEGFDRSLYGIMFESEHPVSANSVADKLFIPQETFKRRVKKMKEKYAQDETGESSARQ
ncbi:hypothetical protein [Streptomyces sp. AN091965]|uniref:hypothetical protein n=1 Tax=Streptomyces sp. AN091965 TaxID=2927803 RepID=UPI001F611366|nr:hypothetical protein [Streptomyces sp. AN091965]MCI3928208.1 hypothetical protein [Streptomyces sp. AN091965]